jgi:ClpP class serine protease
MPNWSEVLNQVASLQNQALGAAQTAHDAIRRQYLNEVFKKTGRNIIAYYSGWLSKPDVLQAEITDEDKNGFMMAVNKLDRAKGLDLFLHTPGGDLAATTSIIDYLRRMFGNDMRAIVPQIAMSAGTILACSCKSIIMAKHSNLGPTDPHLRGIPAYGVIEEFKRAYSEVKKDPAKIALWQQIIGQYRPTFLSQCENAIKWSETFVRQQLEQVMLAGEPNAKKKARQIVKELADYTGNGTHARHIPLDECERIGLKIVRLEDDPELQDLVLTVHHCYMHMMMNTAAFKAIENQLGTAFIKLVQQPAPR